jgi:hypothetical protein
MNNQNKYQVLQFPHNILVNFNNIIETTNAQEKTKFLTINFKGSKHQHPSIAPHDKI